MILINTKQVKWLVINQPETEFQLKDWSGISNEKRFYEDDILYSKKGQLQYYLTTETYNQLPTEFKQLSQC